jgi:hypothetical protein
MNLIRIVLPTHLRALARVESEVELPIEGPLTLGTALDALERDYSMLRGAVRDHGTLRRRPFVRFFACEQDLSHAPLETLLPEAIAIGEEPLLIVGAIAGG